jgi:hypothetical protein
LKRRSSINLNPSERDVLLDLRRSSHGKKPSLIMKEIEENDPQCERELARQRQQRHRREAKEEVEDKWEEMDEEEGEEGETGKRHARRYRQRRHQTPTLPAAPTLRPRVLNRSEAQNPIVDVPIHLFGLDHEPNPPLTVPAAAAAAAVAPAGVDLKDPDSVHVRDMKQNIEITKHYREVLRETLPTDVCAVCCSYKCPTDVRWHAWKGDLGDKMEVFPSDTCAMEEEEGDEDDKANKPCINLPRAGRRAAASTSNLKLMPR